eukprot:Gb_18109 [translate_table: standard]
MTFLLTRATRGKAQSARHLIHLQCHHYSRQTPTKRSAFGIAFDIDGVVLRGRTPIGGASRALRRLYADPSNPTELQVPFVFLTNGGGVRESIRASELSNLLGVHIFPHQVLQGHAPFKKLVNRFGNELVLAVGKGEPANVMSEYGFREVISMDEYVYYFDNIDPLAQYKSWAKQCPSHNEKLHAWSQAQPDVVSKKLQAAFIVSDPVDWGRDIQVLCDVLRSGGLPGKIDGHQPPLFFAADDLEYQGAFPTERLGMGAFRIALESIFNRIHHNPLTYTSFGKPKATVFRDAEIVLQELSSAISFPRSYSLETLNNPSFPSHQMKTVYMIGDNPAVDIYGAQQAGQPWFSILTRTGCFKGKGNHEQFPADMVVDNVEAAIDYILNKHSKEYL